MYTPTSHVGRLDGGKFSPRGPPDPLVLHPAAFLDASVWEMQYNLQRLLLL